MPRLSFKVLKHWPVGDSLFVWGGSSPTVHSNPDLNVCLIVLILSSVPISDRRHLINLCDTHYNVWLPVSPDSSTESPLYTHTHTHIHAHTHNSLSASMCHVTSHILQALFQKNPLNPPLESGWQYPAPFICLLFDHFQISLLTDI